MLEIKENILCFQYMFFYIFIIISLICLRIAVINLPDEDDRQFLVKVMDYWRKKPIWKMKALNVKNNEEPEDKEKYSLATWPGTIEGCNCSSYSYDYYLIDSCSKVNLTNKCANLEEQKPINIYKYKFKYFVNYYDYDYLTLLSRVEKDKNNCKTGYKQCGFLDTLNRPFCVKEEEDCVMNHFYFQNGDYIYLYYGFNQSYTETNYVINNLFIMDSKGCLLNEEYFSDDYSLFKKKDDTLKKCYLERDKMLIRKIPNSWMDKQYVYMDNNIYNGDGAIPGSRIIYNAVYMYSMIYYGLNNSITEYYNSDAFLFKNVKLFNFLIFVFLKVGIQLGYFIFMQKKISTKKREIIYNTIWACGFIIYLILIWMLNNSLLRSGLLIISEIDEDNFYKTIKNLRIIDIVLALIILSAHTFKLFIMITNKGNKKYSQFINKDK